MTRNMNNTVIFEIAAKVLVAAIAWFAMHHLPAIILEGQGGKSLTELLWYAFTGVDSGFWRSVSLVSYGITILTVLAVIVSMVIHAVGFAYSDSGMTIGGGAIALIGLIILLFSTRAVASTIVLVAMPSYGWFLTVAYIIASVVWESYGAQNSVLNIAAWQRSLRTKMASATANIRNRGSSS